MSCKTFTVVGIGPGESAYRIPEADKAVNAADVLMGGERHLALFAHLGKETIVLRGQISSLPDLIRERWLSKHIAVLVSGDPGYHSLLGLLSRSFSPREYRVIPGISSLQLAAARSGKPWQNDLFLSLHGRVLEGWVESASRALHGGKRVFFLTDKVKNPSYICEKLLSGELSLCNVSVFFNLGYENEHEENYRLSQLAGKPLYKVNKETLCVMIISPPSQ